MGKDLVENLLSATGLPEKAIRDEFTELLTKHGKNAETLTLDDLREVLADYLQDVLVGAKHS